MALFKNLFIVIAALFLPVWSSGQSGDLERNFANPPKEYSLLPFWSWNGTLQPGKLKEQVDQMMDKGIYGAFLHARAGLDESETPYFSSGFWTAVDTVINYSAKKGFQACLYDEDKWPSGSAGGRTVAANPDEFIKKALVFNKMEVVGPQILQLNLMSDPLSVFAGRISASGSYESSSQVELTQWAGKEWKVPEGRWAIVAFRMAKDPDRQIDYLDSAAVAKFIEITHEEYFRRYAVHFGKTIPGIFFDEIYANFSKFGNNIFWTDDFLSKFRKLKGYDLRTSLPLILFDEPGRSEKVRHDYFDVVKTLYVNAWFNQYAGWCADHKIWATGHTAEKLLHYKREADYFTTMGQLQVPGADNEEYRYGFPRMIDWFNTRQISSIANLYNRERVMVEAMGGGGYIIPLDEYRYGFSMLAVYGINMFIPHLFHYTTETPWSQADWPPSWFYQNPYWKYFKPLADYASRLSYMNSQGKEVCDVAILYPLTDLWINGYPAQVDDAFYKEVQQVLTDHHIGYNIIDPESLTRAKTDNGRIAAGKGNFKVLILPSLRTLRTDVAEKLISFVKSGGTLIGVRELPRISDSGPVGDEQIISGMKELFGFSPNNLRAEEYFQWNENRTEHFTTRNSTNGGTSIFTRFPGQLPRIIHNRITPDLQVKSSNGAFLRYLHRQAGGKEIYLFVNDRNTSESYRISLNIVGFPSIWDAETGSVTKADNYQVVDSRLEIQLDFKPQGSYFVVVEPGTPDKTKKIKVEKEEVSSTLPVIDLNGDWEFQLVPKALDNRWSSSLEQDTVALPVMKFQPERRKNEGDLNNWNKPGFNDSAWKTVKMEDVFNKKSGIQRYFSGWDAYWIGYYDHSMHIASIEGGDRTFRKEIKIDESIAESKLAITADPSYELIINGQSIGKDNNHEKAEVYDLSKILKTGLNVVEVKTQNTRGLLLQGFVRMKNGKIIPVRSDESWLVSVDSKEWQNAFPICAPPLGVWGKIVNPLVRTGYPATVWYRQMVPPGATSLLPPEIKGNYTLFINGARVNVQPQMPTGLPKYSGEAFGEISVRVEAMDSTCGIISPLRFICGKVNRKLTSWDSAGLTWYSGRALYSKMIDLPESYLNEGRLILDLGQVNYFAEIWVNNRLVTYRSWPPYKADITDFVKSGKNKITLVVANLLANQATWNILDDNINSREARWWHDGTILREKDKLVSGLIGPVKLFPVKK